MEAKDEYKDCKEAFSYSTVTYSECRQSFLLKYTIYVYWFQMNNCDLLIIYIIKCSP